MLDLKKLNKEQLIKLIHSYSDYITRYEECYDVYYYYQNYYKNDREDSLDNDVLNKIYDVLYKYFTYLRGSDIVIDIDSNIYEDLSLDYLDEVELVMALEDEFNIEITDEEWDDIYIVRDIYEILVGKV